jgi:hypothetical protein
MEWPTAEIDRTVRPTEARRASLVALPNATTRWAQKFYDASLENLSSPCREQKHQEAVIFGNSTNRRG